MLLIDGNNLWHAAMECGEPLAGISRSELLALLDELARRGGERVVVALDGPARTPSAGGRGVERLYGGHRSADDLIVRLVAESTDPRRVTVVTSDRELIGRVRRRRVRVVRSERFAAMLGRWAARPDRGGAAEPAAKRTGLGSDRLIDQWLRYFGLFSQPGKGDIIPGERVGSGHGGRSKPPEDPSSPAPSKHADADLTDLDDDISRAYDKVTPLKRRRRARLRRGRGSAS